jgi:hypothetical protein
MVKEKTSLYLLSIVGIVAVVGIVVLLLNGGQVSTEVNEQVSDGDIAGEAIKLVGGKTTLTIDLNKLTGKEKLAYNVLSNSVSTFCCCRDSEDNCICATTDDCSEDCKSSCS